MNKIVHWLECVASHAPYSFLHDSVVGAPTPFWHCPLDILCGIFDAACLAMQAILGMNLQTLLAGVIGCILIYSCTALTLVMILCIHSISSTAVDHTQTSGIDTSHQQTTSNKQCTLQSGCRTLADWVKLCVLCLWSALYLLHTGQRLCIDENAC